MKTEKEGAAPKEPTLMDVLTAVQGVSGNLASLKQTVEDQAEFMDALDGRLSNLETAGPRMPDADGTPLASGMPVQGQPTIADLMEELREVKARPVAGETAAEAEARYLREAKKESARLVKAGHKQMFHFDPDWCLAQDPPVPLTRNVMGAEQLEAAKQEGYYPSLREAAKAAALAAIIRVAQDAAVAALHRRPPEVAPDKWQAPLPEQINDARLQAAQNVKPPSASAIQERMTYIHKQVGKIGHQGWEKPQKIVAA